LEAAAAEGPDALLAAVQALAQTYPSLKDSVVGYAQKLNPALSAEIVAAANTEPLAGPQPGAATASGDSSTVLVVGGLAALGGLGIVAATVGGGGSDSPEEPTTIEMIDDPENFEGPEYD